MKKSGLSRRPWSILRLVRRATTYLKTIRRADSVRYGERQLSFEETPIFGSRPARLRFPCLTAPQVDFDYDFHENDAVSRECGDEEGIDLKAEEFIARFYEQIKLQRQISLLEYRKDNPRRVS